VEVFDALTAVIKKELGQKGRRRIHLPGGLSSSWSRSRLTKSGNSHPFKPGE